MSPELLAALRPGGALRWIIEHAAAKEVGIDFQLRRDGGRSWVSLYLGLTSVLNVVATRDRFHLSVHDTHKKVGAFDPAWVQPQSKSGLNRHRLGIERYLDKISSPSAVAAKHSNAEGRVQAAISLATTTHFAAFQREAVPAFRDVQVREFLVEPFRQRILSALNPSAHKSTTWWPGIRDRGQLPKSGLEADLLALDTQGRLLVMEVKPAGAIKGIAWAPGQVRLYAELFALLFEFNSDARSDLVNMIDQRRALGLPAPTGKLPPHNALRIVPVVAIGDGTMSPRAMGRLRDVHTALELRPPVSSRLDPLEVWHHDSTGRRVKHTVLKR